jgi:L-fucose isomerase-like protein
MSRSALRVGVVSFDYPPFYERGAGGAAARRSILPALLAEEGHQIVQPSQDQDAGRAGLATPADLELCLGEFRARGVDCLLLDLFHWTRPALALALLRELSVPCGLVANTRDGWNGITAVTAISGSLRELPEHRFLSGAPRFRDSEPQDIRDWLRGVAAYTRLRRSRLLCWGGGYGADIPFTRSDPAALESCLVREVLLEQEIVLVERARTIAAGSPQRVKGFLDWLEARGTRIRYGGRLTPQALAFQVALYLAARDRLQELEGEDIAAVSIKCHYELSIAPVGCTACLLPGFLPFAEDAAGPQKALPTACEGDLPGLATLAMLHAVNPAEAPLFGDLAMYQPGFVLLRNCGASAVSWAGGLDHLEVKPNIHGRSGGALSYETPAEPEVTFARLFRVGGRMSLMLGEGSIASPTADSQFPDPWPHTRLVLPVDPYLLYRAAPCNHGSLTRGRRARSLEILARLAGLQVVRCDREASLASYLESI